MKYLIKKTKCLLVIMLVAIFASCTNYVQNDKVPLIIDRFESSYISGLCNYTAIYGNVSGKDYIEILDSCEKYKIGDTLLITKK